MNTGSPMNTGSHTNSTYRQEAVRRARQILEAHPVYLDTETTGLHQSAEIIEIGIIDDQEQVLFDQRIRPRGKIDRAAERVHGISLEDLKDCPTWEYVWPKAEAVLMGKKIGVYNVEFDWKMIKEANRRTWLSSGINQSDFFDIMELYAMFYGDRDPYRRSFRYQSLEMAGRQSGIHLPNAHRAVDDCLLTRALLHYMAESG
jgi:DNA polymerase-3 subunit epsilon